MATSTKRQFLMLSHTWEPDHKENVCGWYMSEKLDGLRLLWDGGVTRGLPVREVPFANIERDDRFVDRNYEATGLWSRNAKVIRAPEWFLDTLPPLPLDGEIWGGRKNWELTSSITKKIVPDEHDWKRIQFHVFDSPALEIVFQDGAVETDIYTKSFTGTSSWVLDRAKQLGIVTEPDNRMYEYVLSWLRRQNIENEYVHLIDQERLPYSTQACLEIINQRMETVVANGGEGLMLRRPESYWSPERVWNLMKVKKWYDDEAIVKYYVWGKRTSKGSKLLGKMGTMGVEWQGKLFEISGFNDSERTILKADGSLADYIGVNDPGGRVPDSCQNPAFPIGSKVTFRYRDLTAIGIPKNGNFMRKPSQL